MVSAWTSTNTMATTSNQFETYASTLDYEDLGQADVYGSVGDFSALELLLAWAPLIDLYGPSYTNFAGRGGHRRAPIIRGLLNLRRKRVYRTHKNKGRKLAGAPRSIHCANGSCENGAVVRESTGAMTIWSANAPPAVPGGG
jgi:hypothetical protein